MNKNVFLNFTESLKQQKIFINSLLHFCKFACLPFQCYPLQAYMCITYRCTVPLKSIGFYRKRDPSLGHEIFLQVQNKLAHLLLSDGEEKKTNFGHLSYLQRCVSQPVRCHQCETLLVRNAFSAKRFQCEMLLVRNAFSVNNPLYLF